MAIDDEQKEQLPAIHDQAIACGTRAELLSGEQARELEPELTPECPGAVLLPDEGLIDPMRLTCAYGELEPPTEPISASPARPSGSSRTVGRSRT